MYLASSTSSFIYTVGLANEAIEKADVTESPQQLSVHKCDLSI